MECGNCFVDETPCWRKINDNVYCNACGLYLKKNKVHKDITLIYAKILMNLKK